MTARENQPAWWPTKAQKERADKAHRAALKSIDAEKRAPTDHAGFLIRVGRGHHAGTDPNGAYWAIHQAGAAKWEVYESGAEVFTAGSLSEARLYVRGEIRERVDPAYGARMRRQREKRRQS